MYLSYSSPFSKSSISSSPLFIITLLLPQLHLHHPSSLFLLSSSFPSSSSPSLILLHFPFLSFLTPPPILCSFFPTPYPMFLPVYLSLNFFLFSLSLSLSLPSPLNFPLFIPLLQSSCTSPHPPFHLVLFYIIWNISILNFSFFFFTSIMNRIIFPYFNLLPILLIPPLPALSFIRPPNTLQFLIFPHLRHLHSFSFVESAILEPEALQVHLFSSSLFPVHLAWLLEPFANSSIFFLFTLLSSVNQPPRANESRSHMDTQQIQEKRFRSHKRHITEARLHNWCTITPAQNRAITT